MKKKAKVDWKWVWKEYAKIASNDCLYSLDAAPYRRERAALENIVEYLLSHKPKKVKGRK